METSPVLKIRELQKHFVVQQDQWSSTNRQVIRAVDGVDLDLYPGETLALVGESGCGKTTLVLTIMGLERPERGSIFLQGTHDYPQGYEVTRLKGKHLQPVRRHMQMIFQDPYASLNPKKSVAQIVMEPLNIHTRDKDKVQRKKRVCDMLDKVDLQPSYLYLPRQIESLSGGERQRVAIASALILKPRVLLADEPLSMLDTVSRKEILALLQHRQKTQKFSIIFITHNLRIAASIADRIAVMHEGRIVETGRVNDIMNHPIDHYTSELLAAVPTISFPSDRNQPA
jgi:ABC-type glutathione transport system ATPase component